MSQVVTFEDGGYRFIRGVFPYSAGVAAAPGFEIERVRLNRPLPFAEGFAAIEAHLKAIGRPMTAFCACEMRSPKPFSEGSFGDFNTMYVDKLKSWNIFRDNTNPIARSNVCPAVSPPAEPSLYAFCYTVPVSGAASRQSFVIAGSAEAPEGKSNYRDHIIRLGDISPEGIREKALWTIGEMERRLAALGFGWADTTATQLYTVHDSWPFIEEEIAQRGAMHSGLTWHYTRPPVVDLEYEMDTRGVYRELVL